jgi:hypothetical protein
MPPIDTARSAGSEEVMSLTASKGTEKMDSTYVSAKSVICDCIFHGQGQLQ